MKPISIILLTQYVNILLVMGGIALWTHSSYWIIGTASFGFYGGFIVWSIVSIYEN